MLNESGTGLLERIQDQIGGRIYSGKYLVANCPFHDDRHPSFFVYFDKYSCKSCGAFGKSRHLLYKLEGIPVRKTKQRIYNPFSRWIRNMGLEKTLKHGYDLGKRFPGQMTYIRGRGINNKTIRKCKLGWIDGWITIPVFDSDGDVCGGVVRGGNTIKSARYFVPQGQAQDLLYVPSWKRLCKHDYIIVVFGVIDALTLYQLGYPAISTLDGTCTDNERFNQFRKFIYVIPDLGEERISRQLVSNLDWRGRNVILDFPEPTKDVNDLFQHDHLKVLDHGLASAK